MLTFLLSDSIIIYNNANSIDYFFCGDYLSLVAVYRNFRRATNGRPYKIYGKLVIELCYIMTYRKADFFYEEIKRLHSC